MFDTRRLLLLCDLVDLGTIAAVAERRGITSSAVSQQLRVLENEAKTILFRRDGRNIRLTLAGEVLVEHAYRVIRVLDEAATAVAAVTTGDPRSAVVSAFTDSLPLLLGPAVRRLQESAEVQVRMVERGSEDALRELRQGDIDLAVIGSSEFDERAPLLSADIVATPLLADPFVLLAPAHLHASVRAEGLRAVADQPWILCGEGTGYTRAARVHAERVGFSLRVEHRVRDVVLAGQLASGGAGLAVVPYLTVAQAHRSLVVDMPPFGVRNISVAQRRGTLRSRNLRLIVDALEQEASRHQGPRAVNAA